MRQEAAASAQQLDERARELAAALSAADVQAAPVGALATPLEDRGETLDAVEQQLSQFEGRLARWEVMGQETTRSLEQLAARQGTVEALQADVDRMFAMAEQTATDVRTITASRAEIEESRTLLEDVMGRLQEVRDTATALDERRRKMAQTRGPGNPARMVVTRRKAKS